MSPVPPASSLEPFSSLFPSPSPQLRTVITYLCGIKDQDIDTVLSQITQDHQYEWIASGFDHLAPRIKNRAQTEEFFRKLFHTAFEDYQYVAIKDYLEMPGKVMLQLKCSSRQIANGSRYENEYIWIFHLTEGGANRGSEPKIKIAKEFFDSLYAAEFFPKQTE